MLFLQTFYQEIVCYFFWFFAQRYFQIFKSNLARFYLSLCCQQIIIGKLQLIFIILRGFYLLDFIILPYSFATFHDCIVLSITFFQDEHGIYDIMLSWEYTKFPRFENLQINHLKSKNLLFCKKLHNSRYFWYNSHSFNSYWRFFNWW